MDGIEIKAAFQAVRKTLEKAGKQLSNTIRIFSDSLKSVNVEMTDAVVMS